MTRKRRNERPSRIPEFTSREEEAKFFDTHDMADFQDAFTTVNVRFGDNLSGAIVDELDVETLAALRERAEAKGVGEAVLVREWALERLREPEGRVPSSG